MISGASKSAVLLINVTDFIRIFFCIFFADVFCMIGGTIVDNDHFIVLICLTEDALQRSGYGVFGVICRYYKSNSFLVHGCHPVVLSVLCFDVAASWIACLTSPFSYAQS